MLRLISAVIKGEKLMEFSFTKRYRITWGQTSLGFFFFFLPVDGSQLSFHLPPCTIYLTSQALTVFFSPENQVFQWQAGEAEFYVC